ncbi:MAG: hypothetical protein ABEJ03_03315 [Candidatus Nanohaloarchaea archaeon]
MRQMDRYRYLVAAFLTGVIFLTGVLVSDAADSFRSQELKTELEQDLVQLESSQIQLNYLRSENVSCSTMKAGLRSIVEGYNDRLSKVQRFQERSLLNSERFELLKKRYTNSGLRYWMFARNMKSECGYSPDIVLFFTSSIGDKSCEKCQMMGEQLSLLKKERGRDLLVFSVPTESDSGMADLLQKKYGVEDPPAAVINGNRTLMGYKSLSELKSVLGS